MKGASIVKSRYPNLLSPIRIGNCLYRNRITVGPTGLHACSNGEDYPNADSIKHFAERARQGAACIVCGGVNIVPLTEEFGINSNWDVYERMHINGLAHLSESIHFYGAKCMMELGGGAPTGGGYAVCDGAPMLGGFEGREMPKEEIKRIVDSYGIAAKVCKDAGFDGVFLHFGHGLQVAQFLSPHSNKRTDEYGGCLENRARFAIEAIDAIREKCGRDFLIEVRISATEFIEDGVQVEDAIAFTELIQDKINIIHVSVGMFETPKDMTITHPCAFLPPTPNVRFAAEFKKSGRIKIPICTIGAIQNLDDAEAIIRDGKADLVCITRGLIADPDLIKKAYNNQPTEDVRPCIKCMRCHDSACYFHEFSCSVNPTISVLPQLETLVKPTTPKKVAIIGGGPAGIQAALTASERGHDVVLFEKSGELGGAIRFAQYVSFKYPLNDYRKYLIRAVTKARVDVRLNTAPTLEELEAENFEVVLVAVGAEHVIPPIPGIENCVTATKVYGQEDQLGDTVLVIGGGQVGCETALHLAKLGKKVSMIEMQAEMAPDASPTHRTELLIELNEEPNLTLINNATCSSIRKGGLSYTDGAGEKVDLEADCVILAAGMRALTKEVDSYLSYGPKVIPIGDCVRARTVLEAVKDAYYAAVNI